MDLLERMEYLGKPVVNDSRLNPKPSVLVNRLRVASSSQHPIRTTHILTCSGRLIIKGNAENGEVRGEIIEDRNVGYP
jgi:hypothetical protein